MGKQHGKHEKVDMMMVLAARIFFGKQHFEGSTPDIMDTHQHGTQGKQPQSYDHGCWEPIYLAA